MSRYPVIGQLLLHLADPGELLVNPLYLGLEQLELGNQLLERGETDESAVRDDAIPVTPLRRDLSVPRPA
jgi:hypothetical protein